jgi:hypothetical protein
VVADEWESKGSLTLTRIARWPALLVRLIGLAVLYRYGYCRAGLTLTGSGASWS